MEELEHQISNLNIKCQCLGGGRILHKPENKYIKVYSYSQVSAYPIHVHGNGEFRQFNSIFKKKWCSRKAAR